MMARKKGLGIVGYAVSYLCELYMVMSMLASLVSNAYLRAIGLFFLVTS